MIRGNTRLIPAFFLLLIFFSLGLLTTRAWAIDWANFPGLSEADKTDITTLAERYGILGPSTAVSIKPVFSRSPYLVIRTPPAGDVLRHSWRELYLCPKDDDGCRALLTESEGNWVVARPLNHEERWRFSEGDWSIDVALDTGISYAEAKTIISAFFLGKLIPTDVSTESVQNAFASHITRISVIDVIAREFNVTLDHSSGSTTYSVRLTDRGIEVFSQIMVTY